MLWLEALLLLFAAGALWHVVRRLLTRAYIRINPRYRQLLDRQGLNSPPALLGVPAVIVSGHPDRNVARMTLGNDGAKIHAYLKREHRVRWKQRLANFLAGYGPVSVCHREALTLRRLRRAGIGCPEWIAVGADGNGRAFLLVKALPDNMDLRRFLSDSICSDSDRRRFACHLGKTLAHLHDAGFSHPDLYAKHILVHPSDWRISFLDWQRSRRRHHVGLDEGWRDLAALDATLADELAQPRERFLCLRAYINARLAASLGRARTGALSALARGSRLNERILFRRALATIREHRERLMQRRHIHEARQLPAVSQELIWLDGEALCVTPGYQRDHAGVLPVLQLPECKDVVRATVPLPRGRQGFFIRRRMDCFVSWLTSRIRGKPVATPEVRQAGLLYRLQRYGVSTAKLLAFGQRQVSPWRTESFLLTEPPARSRGLAHWLAEGSTSRRQRWKLLGEIGRMMQRLHAAGCCLLDHVPGAKTAPLLSVVETDADNQHVMLTRIDGVRHCRKVRESETVRDLTTMHRQHQSAGLSRTDELRVILAYLGQKRLTADGKRFVRQVESQNRQEAHA